MSRSRSRSNINMGAVCVVAGAVTWSVVSGVVTTCVVINAGACVIFNAGDCCVTGKVTCGVTGTQFILFNFSVSLLNIELLLKFDILMKILNNINI